MKGGPGFYVYKRQTVVGDKTRSDLMADKWVKSCIRVWLFPGKRLDHEFAQKEEKQQGREMVKAKVASLEKNSFKVLSLKITFILTVLCAWWPQHLPVQTSAPK